MKLVVAAEGASGRRHLKPLADFGVDVVGLAGGDLAATRAVCGSISNRRLQLDLEEMMALTGVDAVILATPIHAVRAIRCLTAGRHVQVESPMADRLQPFATPVVC